MTMMMSLGSTEDQKKRRSVEKEDELYGDEEEKSLDGDNEENKDLGNTKEEGEENESCQGGGGRSGLIEVAQVGWPQTRWLMCNDLGYSGPGRDGLERYGIGWG